MSGDADKAMIETARRLAEDIYARWWNLGGVSKDRRKIMAERAALAALAALRPGDRLPGGLVVVREVDVRTGYTPLIPDDERHDPKRLRVVVEKLVAYADAGGPLFAPDGPAPAAQSVKDGDDPLGR